MKKIPTMFQRDWEGDRSRVVNEIVPGCEWVLAGEGRATVKLDGTCVMIRDGIRYKRREVREDKPVPDGFEKIDEDVTTYKMIGWVPVGDSPEDKYHREAEVIGQVVDGTYELVGPKIQGNPEHSEAHVLIRHGVIAPDADSPRTFDGLAEWFKGRDYEGIVFHHQDGRMAKIKARDFGLKRQPVRD